MSQVPIVQGVAVPSGGYTQQPSYGQQQQSSYGQQNQSYEQQPYNQQGSNNYGQSGGGFGSSAQAYQPAPSEFNGVKGEPQTKQYQDVLWSVLFFIHLAVMAVIMISMTGNVSNENGYNYSGVVWCVSMCALVAVGLSSIALGFMMQFATELVKMALIFSVCCSLAMAIMGVMAGQMMMALMGFASFALGCCYAYFVWKRIPVSDLCATCMSLNRKWFVQNAQAGIARLTASSPSRDY